MRWRKLTLGTRLAFIITLGFSVGIVALALTLIQLQSQAAAEQLQNRQSRLTQLIADEIAPALHLGDSRIIGKKAKAFINASKGDLALFKAYDLSGELLHTYRSDNLKSYQLDEVIHKHLDELLQKELYELNTPDHYVVFRSAHLPDDTLGGFTGIAWSKAQLNASQQELLTVAFSTTAGVLIVGTLVLLLLINRLVTRPVSKLVLTMDHGSQEIADANQDLADRTNRQSASLEETAASMEEMESIVKNNTAEVKRANKLVKTTRESADQSRAQVLDTVQKTIASNTKTLLHLQETNTTIVEAMSDITDSSKRIGGIINLINDITFQTNLLALNASVEAARAGEHGKGFAVVASEIRKLAYRSSKASKKISDLIETSLERINTGRELVTKGDSTLTELRGETDGMLTQLREETGENLDLILKAVVEFSEVMEGIEAASAEHVQGIEQVNKAITDMDQLTQENAAVVEQTATASTSMAYEAKRLRDLFVSSNRADPVPRPEPELPPASAKRVVATEYQQLPSPKNRREDLREFE